MQLKLLIIGRFLELAQLQMNQEAAGDEPSGVQYQVIMNIIMIVCLSPLSLPVSPFPFSFLLSPLFSFSLLHFPYLYSSSLTSTLLVFLSPFSPFFPPSPSLLLFFSPLFPHLLQIYGTYDNELHQLHETFQSIVVHLLSDTVSKLINKIIYIIIIIIINRIQM